MEKIPEQCFAITLTSHSVQTQILLMHDHSFGLITPHQVHAVYTMHTCRTIFTGAYNMVCDVKHTYAIQTLHVRYVEFNGMVGDGGSWQLTSISQPPSSPFVQCGWAGHRFPLYWAVCQAYRVGGCGFLGCLSPWCLWLPSCASVFLTSL